MRSADFFVFTLDAVAPRKYGGGTGEPNTPYLIATAEHLNTIGTEPDDWDEHFQQTADVDLGAFTEDQFNIIGTDPNAPFRGVFDGQGHTIANFHYATIHRENVGLFGVVADPNARIENVTLIAPSIEVSTGWYTGSLVRLLQEGALTNCHTCNATVRGLWVLGGIVGQNGYAELWMDTYPVLATISNCSFEGSIDGVSMVGGLIGTDSGGTIKGCFATGSIVAEADTGGLIGNANGTVITNCYSTCSVDSRTWVGGLIGCSLGASISQCCSAGRVAGSEDVGGLVKDVFGNTTTVQASFWDTDTSGQTTSDGGVGKTTAEMQMAHTFLEAGWDFAGETENGEEDIWWILDGQDYPRLWWGAGTGR